MNKMRKNVFNVYKTSDAKEIMSIELFLPDAKLIGNIRNIDITKTSIKIFQQRFFLLFY